MVFLSNYITIINVHEPVLARGVYINGKTKDSSGLMMLMCYCFTRMRSLLPVAGADFAKTDIRTPLGISSMYLRRC